MTIARLRRESSRFRAARDQLLALRLDADAAAREFRWPVFEKFNWVGDHFDVVAGGLPRVALRVVGEGADDLTLTYAEIAERSRRVAGLFKSKDIGPGDRILVMLGNVVALWETMLAAMRIGAVVIPATTLLQREELADRIERGRIKAVVAHHSLVDRFAHLSSVPVRISVGGSASGWISYNAVERIAPYDSVAETAANDLLLLYFTSGTTAKPKLVAHTL